MLRWSFYNKPVETTGKIKALVYNGEKIAEGTEKKIRATLKKIFSLKEESILAKLEEITKKVKRSSYFEKRILEMKPPNFLDIRSGGTYRLHEIDSFIELELKYNGISRASKASEAGDIIMETGELAGKSLDPLGLAKTAIAPWKRNLPDRFFDFKSSIKKHFAKIHTPTNELPPLDIVVIDFKYMDEISPTLKQQVLDYIESPMFKYKQYVNEKHLIKLNL